MVRITNMRTEESYIATSVADCRDSVDISGYALCQSMKCTIAIGEMVFDWIKEEK